MEITERKAGEEKQQSAPRRKRSSIGEGYFPPTHVLAGEIPARNAGMTNLKERS